METKASYLVVIALDNIGTIKKSIGSRTRALLDVRVVLWCNQGYFLLTRMRVGGKFLKYNSMKIS